MCVERSRSRLVFAISVLLLLFNAAAGAQTVIDPRLIEFQPSTDHNAVMPDGQSIVQRYDLAFYQLGALQPFMMLNLGKPAPDSDGRLRVDFTSSLYSWPLPGLTYEARVRAIGPTGSASSEPSNDFSFSGPCNYLLSAASQSFGAGGGSGSVVLNTGSTCLWTATSPAAWITPTTGSGGGASTITYVVAPNTTTKSRTETLTIATQKFTVSQAAGSGTGCSYTLSSSSKSFTASGGSSSISVTTTTGCAWTAASNTSWITVTAGAAGNGSGTVSYTVAANTSTTSRSGTLTIAGKTFTVSQSGTTSSCSYTLSSTSQSFVAGGGSGSVSVTTGTACAWTATSGSSWITVTSAASRSGSGTVGYTVAANTSSSSRTGTLSIAGKTFTVTQNGASTSCSFSLSATSLAFGSNGGSGSVTVTTSRNCSWTASSYVSWITVPGRSRNGKGTDSVSFTVATNSSSTSRTGTLRIAGKTLTVAQSGTTSACGYTLSSSGQSFGAGGGTTTVTVTTVSGCAWAATSGANWIIVTAGATGSGTGTVTYAVAVNTSTSPRTGTLTIAGKTVMVSQASASSGSGCTYTLSTLNQSIGAAGGSASLTLTTSGGCPWTASSGVSWITLTAGLSGSGSGTVSFTVAPNSSTSQRTGTLTVAGTVVTVVQGGTSSSCVFSVSLSAASFGAGGGTATVKVATFSTCGWKATTTASWITVEGGMRNHNGGDSLNLTVGANASPTARVTTLTVAGQILAVTQQGASAP